MCSRWQSEADKKAWFDLITISTVAARDIDRLSAAQEKVCLILLLCISKPQPDIILAHMQAVSDVQKQADAAVPFDRRAAIRFLRANQYGVDKAVLFYNNNVVRLLPRTPVMSCATQGVFVCRFGGGILARTSSRWPLSTLASSSARCVFFLLSSLVGGCTSDLHAHTHAVRAAGRAGQAGAAGGGVPRAPARRQRRLPRHAVHCGLSLREGPARDVSSRSCFPV